MQAVVFDFDGVLADSEPLHFAALRDCLAEEGIAIGETEYYELYLAYDDRTAIRIALEHHGRPPSLGTLDAMARRKAELFDARLAEIRFFPGARELVRALAAEVPLAIASGALRHEIEAILAAGGLRDAFLAVVGANDVRQGKPHPEPYLEAVRQLARGTPGLCPEQCVAIEDSAAGAAAARAAGMTVVGVAHSGAGTKLNAAHLVVAELSELTPARLRALVQDAATAAGR